MSETERHSKSQVSSRIGPLERAGHAMLRRHGPTCPGGVGSADARLLSEDEQLKLRKIARAAVVRAAMAGGLSALVCALAAVYAEGRFAETWMYWCVIGGVSLVAAAMEVGFLYWDAIRTVHRISSICDVELFPADEERSRMAGIMVRAAMELPNPPDRDPYIDPFRSASKLRILVGVLLYKGKVMLSNAIAKLLVRKMLTRGVARAWLEFIAIPVTAAWNALVCFWVLREARVRAIGPSAVLGALPKLLDGASEKTQMVSQRAVACSVAASRDLHPNHLYMLEWMREHAGVTVETGVDDEAEFAKELSEMSAEESETVLDVLALAAVIDGKVAPRERDLLGRMLELSGRASDTTRLVHQAKTFRQGQPVPKFSGAH